MANISKVTITIDKPVEKVWEKLMDPESLKHWLTGFVSMEHVSGEYGKPGSVSKLKFFERGKELDVTETVIDIKPNQQYTFNMTSIPFDVDTDIQLNSIGSSTEMTQTVQFFPKNFSMKLMMSVFKGAMKKRMEDELIRFKKYVETA